MCTPVFNKSGCNEHRLMVQSRHMNADSRHASPRKEKGEEDGGEELPPRIPISS